ncbi:uncharacterized protein CTHT_0042140 [Thermochaetoides thermophila DSM 1495]|uniref:Uncharacterized protein n=1 Tax=Chaetomium thermophilum (strain DSM 1495 / CBS 144.50 / IMI 039719) TaxID=759272 RepID=G0SAG0_CHATD|nr:hypothetical protein CTHT_0042140 [Thermochaetoides thermophila DSM 1495]EGS19732.1 hypothetical protein CTHT_0042140 [Thermochaetoides thermophila DSM 1495]
MPDASTNTPSSTTAHASTQSNPTTSHASTQTHHAQQQPQQEPPRATGAGVNTGAGITRPKTEEELEADRRYEEAIEEEYAKREGGA